MEFLRIVRQTAEKRIIYTLHALDEMNAEDEYLAIITVYIPSLEKWESDYRTRRGK